MENKIQKEKIISALFWKFLERGGSQLISFVIQIILARLLAPDQFGIIAVVLVFINLANVFITSGLGTSLVQKKDTDELDYTSIFYVSLSIAIILYLMLFFSSTYIAKLYDFELLASILRVLGITLLFGSFNTIQEAYLQKNMLFKKQLFVTSIAIVISGGLGIAGALNEFGIWALVIQQLSFSVCKTITLFFVVQWYPKRIFSFKRVKILYSFGWKLLVSSFINVLSKDLRTLIIGFKYSTEDLAYYDRGNQIPSIIINNVNGSIQSVLLPTLSSYQDDKVEMRAKTRRSIRISSYVIVPMMFGLAIVAEPMVILLLTEKWLFSVSYIQIFSLSYALYPIHTANLQAINAMGRSDIFLKLEITKVTISIIILLITIPLGIYAIAIGNLIFGIISSFINAFPNKLLLDYLYVDQIKDVGPSIIISFVMALLIYPVKFFIFSNLWLVLVQMTLGLMVYVFLSWLFRLESLKYIISIIKEYISIFKRKNNKN